MGGRGSKSRIQPQPIQMPRMQMQMPPQPPQQPPQPNPIANQVPDDTNTPVMPDALDTLQGMNDAQLAQLFRQSQATALPNHLDDASDQTQKFIFAIGMNDKPTVLDQAEFTQFMADNGIPQSQVLSRSVNGGTLKTSAGNQRNLTAQDVSDILKYSRMNYIGGKHGGQAYGAGACFDMNGGGNTGYASGHTDIAVLNPKTARVITDSRLAQLARQFDRTHPQFARATGGYSTNFSHNNMSIYATVLGYNVIKGGGSYHTIIDRKAIVIRK